MEMTLAENIRAFRKARSLTQDQLAEVLGVTAGAVYKWEAKLSVPDIELIIRMADFFDTSVDVLLGYKMKDNRLDATVQRLRDLRRAKDRAGLAEAEKALKKYPHSFRIVYECANMYRAFGFESGDKALHRRALELTEQAILLLPQNDDPEISEQTLYGKMAEIYWGLDEPDKSIELWKSHNAGGMFNSKLGQIIAGSEHPDEAEPYLSESLLKIVTDLSNTVIGYLNLYLKRGDHDSARAILHWGSDALHGLGKEGRPSLLDKIRCVFETVTAGSHFMTGDRDEAERALKKAMRIAKYFDAAPSFDECDIRFVTRIEGASAHDDMGATAMDSIDTAVSQFEIEEFTALWESVKTKENKNYE
ncbi:MAG: helix-turn-helix domain-containing protein [Oscillospiraceae bacterium]|nr:helix-turn-helix domain-containing protein [Oscillospiraceae bacterium]